MSELTFDDATPVKKNTGGPTAAPNPYTKIIKEIALVKDKSNQPVAKAFTYRHDTWDTVKTDQGRIKRQLTAAGRNNDPRVTVRVSFTDVTSDEQIKPGTPKVKVHKTRVTFWTVAPYQPKSSASTQPANTNTPNTETPESE